MLMHFKLIYYNLRVKNILQFILLSQDNFKLKVVKKTIKNHKQINYRLNKIIKQAQHKERTRKSIK